MGRDKVTLQDVGMLKKPPRKSELFFDTWSPQMAWCLGVIYQRGAVVSSHSTLVDSANLDLLRAFHSLVKESKLHTHSRSVVIESIYMGDRLLELGMPDSSYGVDRVPPIPEEYVPYVIRGILDTHSSSICTFGWTYLAQIELILPCNIEGVFRLMRRELKKRNYHVQTELKDIDYYGILNNEPVGVLRRLKMTRPREIIDCYKWLFSNPRVKLPFNGTQRWMWSQLEWMSRDIDACAKLLADKEMVSELRRISNSGKRANVMVDWQE